MFNLPVIKLAFCAYLSIVPVLAKSVHLLPDVQVEQQLEEKLYFIGEVKERSYIKLELEPVQAASEFSTDNEFLKYKGVYYESASDRKYMITGTFNVAERSWVFRCFNTNNRQVFLLKGKQKQDGSIEGTWRSKTHSYPFYLRPQ